MRNEAAHARFVAVFMAHLDDAYALARWLTNNATDAEDVVQQACLKAMRGIEGYSGGNARAWTLAIVRNTALSWMVKNRPGALSAIDDAGDLDELAVTHETPETAFIEKAESARVNDAIASLPAYLRETFVLREVNGMSYRDIADVTQSPIGTVMSRLARSRAMLFAIIGKE